MFVASICSNPRGREAWGAPLLFKHLKEFFSIIGSRLHPFRYAKELLVPFLLSKFLGDHFANWYHVSATQCLRLLKYFTNCANVSVNPSLHMAASHCESRHSFYLFPPYLNAPSFLKARHVDDAFYNHLFLSFESPWPEDRYLGNLHLRLRLTLASSISPSSPAFFFNNSSSGTTYLVAAHQLTFDPNHSSHPHLRYAASQRTRCTTSICTCLSSNLASSTTHPQVDQTATD